MQMFKNPAPFRIKLQAGAYCHLYDDKLIINDVTTIEEPHLKERLNVVKKGNVFQYLLNIILTSALVIIVLLTSFYIFIPLLFLSIWHLRKLKKQNLPMNQSNCIPLKYVTGMELIKGRLDFNYLLIHINFEKQASMKLLRLYDSRSTMEQVLGLFPQFLNPEIGNDDKKIVKGIKVPFTQKEYYIIEEDTWYFVNANGHNPKRADNYLYYRWISLLFSAFGLFVIAMFVVKTYQNQLSWHLVDTAVLIMLFLLVSIPIKYLSKSIPNQFKSSEIKKVSEKKHYFIISVNTASWWLPLKIILKKKYLSTEEAEYLRNICT